MKRYINLLRYFQEWNPEVVEKMKNCSHHFDLKNTSPYHMEDDVWTHTILAYKDLVSNYYNMEDDFSELINELYEPFFDYDFSELHYILAVIVLCHDIGKIYNRFVPKGQYGKIAMHGHSFSSVQFTIDFISYLHEKNVFLFSDNQIYIILNIVSNHMDYYTLSIKDRILLANNMMDIFYLGEIFNNIDKRNSLDKKCEFMNTELANFDSIKEGLSFIHYQKLIGYNQKNDIMVFCGSPGSGKDYIAEKEYNIVSYDDIRVELFLKDNPDVDSLYTEKRDLYADAWEYCNKVNYDLNRFLKLKVDDLIANNKKVAICNTSLTRKSRRTLSNIFKKYNINIVYVGVKSDFLIWRNENRNSKELSKLVMNKFMYNQQVPSLFDTKNTRNVKNIKFIFNNGG